MECRNINNTNWADKQLISKLTYPQVLNNTEKMLKLLYKSKTLQEKTKTSSISNRKLTTNRDLFKIYSVTWSQLLSWQTTLKFDRDYLGQNKSWAPLAPRWRNKGFKAIEFQQIVYFCYGSLQSPYFYLIFCVLIDCLCFKCLWIIYHST